MSSATFYKWRAKYGGMDASLMKRLKGLEDENRGLKTMYAKEHIKADIARDALQKSGDTISSQSVGTTSSGRTRCESLACQAVGISEACSRYQPILASEN